ncbi:MAG: hypothetical protein LPH21_19020, partial [Shewanella sp.]|nr:hypothetical protein [Shewanella sp.]
MHFESKDALDTFIGSMRDYVDAGAALIHVRTSEIERTLGAILSSIIHDTDTVEMWNFMEGMVTPTQANYKNIIPAQPVRLADPMQALALPYEYLKFIESPAGSNAGVEPPFARASEEPPAHYVIFSCIPGDIFKVPK